MTSFLHFICIYIYNFISTFYWENTNKYLETPRLLGKTNENKKER